MQQSKCVLGFAIWYKAKPPILLQLPIMSGAAEFADRPDISVALTDRQAPDQRCRLMDVKYFRSKQIFQKVPMKARNVFTDCRRLWSGVGERKNGGKWIKHFESSKHPGCFAFYLQLITAATDPQWRKEKMCGRRNSGAVRAERWVLINGGNSWGGRCAQTFYSQSPQTFYSISIPSTFLLPIPQLIAQQFPPSNPATTHLRSWSFFDRIQPSKHLNAERLFKGT